jgi:hypothetical protein
VNPAKPEQAVLFRELRWGLMLLMSIFPMIFPLVGCLVSVGGLFTARQASQGRKLEMRHPGEPWRWRQEWSGETIQASKTGLPFILGVAGWILLIQGPLALAIIVSGELSHSLVAALGLLPSLLALIPLFFAWQRFKTRSALGKPSLWLKQTPIRPGGALEGELRFDRVLSPREVIQARLLCQRKITRRTGKGTSTSTENLWEHTQTLSASEARREMTGVALPLRVEIPPGLPCAVVEDAAFITGSGEQHVWSLEVSPVSGGKAAVLPLPVFVTGEQAKLAESDTSYEVEAIAPSTEQLVERLNHGGMQVEFDADGLPTLLRLPAGSVSFPEHLPPHLRLHLVHRFPFFDVPGRTVDLPHRLGHHLAADPRHRPVDAAAPPPCRDHGGRAAYRESRRAVLLMEGKLRPAPLRRLHARLEHAVRQPVLLPRPRRDDLRQKENPHRRHHRIRHRRDAGEAAGGLEEAWVSILSGPAFGMNIMYFTGIKLLTKQRIHGSSRR